MRILINSVKLCSRVNNNNHFNGATVIIPEVDVYLSLVFVEKTDKILGFYIKNKVSVGSAVGYFSGVVAYLVQD